MTKRIHKGVVTKTQHGRQTKGNVYSRFFVQRLILLKDDKLFVKTKRVQMKAKMSPDADTNAAVPVQKLH